MKKYVFLIMIMTGVQTIAQQTLEWSFFHPIREEWMELGTKGSVQEALIRSGELPDPFYGMNEEKFAWLEDYEWKLKSIFFVDSDYVQHPVELDFEGIDTYAKLYINEVFVDSFENAFIPYHLKIDSYLKAGLNEMVLEFTPPVLYHKNRWETERYHLPAPNDVNKIAIAPYTRKPQYQFGWDWSLRMNTIGLIGEAKLTSVNAPKIWNSTVKVLHADSSSATIEYMIDLTDKSIHEIEWSSELFGTERTPSGADGKFYRRVVIQNPELWWPRGMGKQALYTDNWRITNKADESFSEMEKTFGIKTSELVIEPDQWGTSYYFRINGKRVFAKGGDYIPQDVFPSKITDEDVIQMVEEMAASNFNMVRIWGGGFYQKEAFYKACDEKGIMVWQDLMFACAMYPGDSAFLANVKNEFEYQMPRIASHPSVVLFNGNNEVEVAWGNWGFQIKYGLYGKSAKEIEEAYDKLFKHLAPDMVNRYTSIPYIHTSPLSNWGKDEYYNNGSQHYWGVWHGKDPIEDFGKKIGRFNAEYGFQSFPEFNTLRSFSTEADWNIASDVMKQHQKSYVGNDMILKHAKRLYGDPKDFNTFVYYSQLTQAMAVSMAIAGHRIDAPRCGGTLYWQVNDCWPVSSWSSIDYYNNWKALQYRAREDYRDLAILEKYEDLENRSYYIVCDSSEQQNIKYTWKLFRLNGKLAKEGKGEMQVNDVTHGKIDIEIPKKKRKKKQKSYVLQIEAELGNEKYTRSFDHLTPNYLKEVEERKVCLELQEVNPEEKTAKLVVTSASFIADLWLTCDKFHVRYSDNFFSMLPGTKVVTIHFEEEPEQSDFHFYFR